MAWLSFTGFYSRRRMVVKYQTVKFKRFYHPNHEDEIGIPFTFNQIELVAVSDGKFYIYDFYSGLKLSFIHRESIKSTIMAIEKELKKNGGDKLTIESIKKRRSGVSLINKRFNRKSAEHNNKILWRE